MTTPTTIQARVERVKARIARALEAAGRASDEVSVVAVSKGHDADAIRAVYATGLRAFGENYLQEALAKQALLDDLPITWHYQGGLQSNKASRIATRFHWIDSVDRPEIARRLSQASAGAQPVLLEVRLVDDPRRHGVSPTQLPALVEACLAPACTNLVVRGLMAVGPDTDDPGESRRAFATLRTCLETLKTGFGLARADTLSMGMSHDFEAAISEGATVIRLGSVLFGPRSTA